MSRSLVFGVVYVIFVLMVGIVTLPAQQNPPLADTADLVLHPGDTIVWAPTGNHRLRFGGTLAGTTLTPFGDVKKIITDFKPAPSEEKGDVAAWPVGAKVTAIVRSDAPPTAGGPGLTFTCGVHQPQMITVNAQFTVQAKGGKQRNVDIVFGAGLHWILRTPAGDKRLTGGK
jgi:hypothetical protein